MRVTVIAVVDLAFGCVMHVFLVLRSDGPHQANRAQVHWRQGPSKAARDQGRSQVRSLLYSKLVMMACLIRRSAPTTGGVKS
jgi:hypothetical protein